MKLTEFTGYDDKPIMIDTEKIMAVTKSKVEDVTSLTMQCGWASEEWFVKMPLNKVLERIQP